MLLAPSQYVFGWTHNEDSLTIKFYEASSGKPLGTVGKRLSTRRSRGVASFRVWPPSEKSVMQIGRFTSPISSRNSVGLLRHLSVVVLQHEKRFLLDAFI